MKLGFWDDIGKMLHAGYNNGVTAPSVVITSTEPNPTDADPIPILFEWSEGVYSFGSGDVTFTNATADSVEVYGQDLYLINIIPDGAGEITVQVPAGGCTNLAGTENLSSDTFSITYTP